jgi:hypothetical protein
VGVAVASADRRFWGIVPTPSPDTFNSLHDLSLLDQKDGWAVGLQGPNERGPFAQLSEHWDGRAWAVVPMPSVGDTSTLFGVAAIGRNDAWAVGSTVTAGFSSALIDHWDGLSWSVVPGAFVSGDEATLYDIAALSSRDVWAAGYLGSGPAQKPILEHWDGLAWNLVVPPAVGDQSAFVGIDAAAADDVWAVGWSVTAGVNAPLAEHWDGSAWSIVDVPGPAGASFLDVTAGRDVWAVGQVENGPTGPVKTLAEHWDGHAWTRAATPDPADDLNVLLGVRATSAHDVWAVGYASNGPTGLAEPLIEHFDGGIWSVVPAGLRDDFGFLRAVELLSPTKGIAVGGTTRVPPLSPLSEFTLVEQLSSH